MLVTQDAVRYVCPQLVAFPAPVPAHVAEHAERLTIDIDETAATG
ncbi:MAG: hypothetical protein AABM64_12005 [Pseudomonadota bacterium]